MSESMIGDVVQKFWIFNRPYVSITRWGTKICRIDFTSSKILHFLYMQNNYTSLLTCKIFSDNTWRCNCLNFQKYCGDVVSIVVSSQKNVRVVNADSQTATFTSVNKYSFGAQICTRTVYCGIYCTFKKIYGTPFIGFNVSIKRILFTYSNANAKRYKNGLLNVMRTETNCYTQHTLCSPVKFRFATLNLCVNLSISSWEAWEWNVSSVWHSYEAEWGQYNVTRTKHIAPIFFSQHDNFIPRYISNTKWRHLPEMSQLLPRDGDVLQRWKLAFD